MRFPVLRHRALRVVGAAMSLFALSAPAGAFTVSELPLPKAALQPTVALFQEGVDQPKLEQVIWRGGGGWHGGGWHGGGWHGGGWGWHGGGWHGGGWGWGGGAFVGGLAAGALLAGPYYGGYYGGPYGYYGGGYYPGCWRSVWTYYGWRRVWAC
jgi:hypothetical protein